jgi:hypothetical protein
VEEADNVDSSSSSSSSSVQLADEQSAVVISPTNTASGQQLAAISTVHNMTADELADLLRQLKMSHHASTFAHNDIDGRLLTLLDEHMLVEDLAMTRFEARKLMAFVRNEWRPITWYV